MRLELGHREAVVERCAPLLSELERLTAELVSRPLESEQIPARCAALADVVSTLRLACSSVPVLEPVAKLFDGFAAALTGVGAASVALTPRTATILTNAVAAATKGVANLGTESKAAKLIPKVLSDVTRLLSGLAGAPAQAAIPAPVIEPAAMIANRFREAFLEDEDGNFSKIAELSRALTSSPAAASTLDDLFRQVHTVKGNAMALGLGGLANFAHAFESELERARAEPALTADVARALAESAGTLLVIRETCRERGAATPVAPPTERATFLSVKLDGRDWLVPCASVTEVLRRPRVLALPARPGAPKAGDELLGAVRSRGLFVPLIAGPALIPRERRGSPPWAVVLREAGSESPSALVCLPVDDIGAVQELPAAQAAGQLIDLRGVIGKAA